MRSIIGWCKHTGCWQIQSRVNQATGKILNITHKSASTCSITIVWHMYGLRGTATWAPDRILFLQHMVATLGSIVNHAPVCVCYLINVWQGYLGTVLYCAFNWALYGSVICTLCVWGVTKATAWGAVCSSSNIKSWSEPPKGSTSSHYRRGHQSITNNNHFFYLLQCDFICILLFNVKQITIKYI